MHPLVSLAKLAVENYIEKAEVIPAPKDLPEEFLTRKSGAFVTIEKDNELCGCIGTYLPTKINIAEEIIHNAISAATEDYRFDRISKEELPSLSYTVYILNEPELVKDIKELNPKKYGIIVKTSDKLGLLLPDLQGVDTVAQQISICCQKGEIDPKKEEIMIFKFTVEKYQ